MVQRRLSQREQEILQLVAEGYRNREIAASCNISEQTVKNHVSTMLLKLGVNNRTGAVVLAAKTGLLPEIGTYLKEANTFELRAV